MTPAEKKKILELAHNIVDLSAMLLDPDMEGIIDASRKPAETENEESQDPKITIK